nr:uncharacterized protein LOC129272326 [Lytechinus pictus]
MADEQKETDAPGSDGFSAQNQQNDDSSMGNDGGENAETSPGSYRSREDGSEMEASITVDDELPPTFVRLAPIITTSEAIATGESTSSTPSVEGIDQAASQNEGTPGSGDTEYKFVDGKYVQYTPTGAEGDGSPQLMDFNGKSSSVASVDGGQGFICKVCGAWYKLRQSLNSHIQDQHQGKRFKCSKCPYSTNRRHDLYRHDGQVHRGSAKQTVPLVSPLAPKSKSNTVAAALKKREEKKLKKATAVGTTSFSATNLSATNLTPAGLSTSNLTTVNLSSPVINIENKSVRQVLNQGDVANTQQLVVVSDGMQGAVYPGSSSPLQDQVMKSGWVEENSSSSKPHRQTESFEHQLPSGAIFRRITEITFFPDGRIQETRTEEYEMP